MSSDKAGSVWERRARAGRGGEPGRVGVCDCAGVARDGMALTVEVAREADFSADGVVGFGLMTRRCCKCDG